MLVHIVRIIVLISTLLHTKRVGYTSYCFKNLVPSIDDIHFFKNQMVGIWSKVHFNFFFQCTEWTIVKRVKIFFFWSKTWRSKYWISRKFSHFKECISDFFFWRKYYNFLFVNFRAFQSKLWTCIIIILYYS